MTDNEVIDSRPEFKNRKAGLVVFGILQILFGALCSFIVPLMLLSMLVGHSGSASRPTVVMMLPAVLIYTLLAVWFIWMGIGSILARRWARALLLVVSWVWLITGITSMVMVLFFMPDMYDQMGANGQMSQEVITRVKFIMMGFMSFIYVIMPGITILFYGSKHVKATCEQRDPCVRWTDRCPLPVLAVSLTAGLWAVAMPCAGIYGWSLPFFGVLLGGWAGAAVAILFMILLGYVAWGTYRLTVKSWLYAVILTILWGISTTITFSRVSLMDFYEKMNLPAEQLALMESYAQDYTSPMVLFPLIWGIIVLAYLFYIKKYFVSSGEEHIPDVR